MSRLGQANALSSPFPFIKCDSDPNIRHYIRRYRQCREITTERDAVIDDVWFDFVAFSDGRDIFLVVCWDSVVLKPQLLPHS